MGERIHSIDAMRIIAMVFIVIVHTNPFEGVGQYGNMANFLLETTARFAVPFFFMTSGYFFSRNATRGDPTDYFTKQVATIASIYVFGMLVAAPGFLTVSALRASAENRDVVDSVVRTSTEFVSPLELLYYGTSVSEILWFLPALIYSYVFLYLFNRAGKTTYLLPIALGLHCVGLMGASYTMFVDVPLEIRDPVFFGFFYTSLSTSQSRLVRTSACCECA